MREICTSGNVGAPEATPGLPDSPVRRGAPRKASFPAPFALAPNAKVLHGRRGLEGTDLGQALIPMLRGGALGVDSPCARKTVGSPQQFGSENRPIVAGIQLCTAADWWGVPTIFAAGRVTRLALSKPRSPGSTVKRSSHAARCDQ